MTIFRRIFGGGKPKGQFNENQMRTELASVYGDAYANNPEVYETSYRESPTRRQQDQQIYAQNVFNANQAELMNGFDQQVANLNQQVDTNLYNTPVTETEIQRLEPRQPTPTPRRSFGGKRKTSTPAVEKDWSHPGRVAENDVPTPPSILFSR